MEEEEGRREEEREEGRRERVRRGIFLHIMLLISRYTHLVSDSCTALTAFSTEEFKLHYK